MLTAAHSNGEYLPSNPDAVYHPRPYEIERKQ